MPAPEETERRPWRAPGCEGAKVRATVHEAPPARTDGQLVESVKSPATETNNGKGCVPVFETVVVWELADVVVTTTELGKLSVEGVRVRFGLTVEPPTPGCGMVWPVT